jgi:radical SAM superfamily enzyme YgiQ (UPF0313 family)
MRPKPRILLINPKRKYRYNWDMQDMVRLMGKKTIATPLALPLVAALTPPPYEVEIVDEDVQNIPHDISPDLVGITALISNISRAYEIADLFLSKNIPVVLGGPQISFNPEESSNHCTSMVFGEAEGVWPALLKDFGNGCLKKIYKRTERTDFKTSPLPRWDLVKTSAMLSYTVQVSRGCCFSCDFCLIKKMFGKGQYYRDLDNVLSEIKAIPPKSLITFADDNLTADKAYTRTFLKMLAPLKKSWTCQISMETALDIELVKQMAAAGCQTVLVGFETLSRDNLVLAGKKQNDIEKYGVAIRNLHDAGIYCIASMVAGFDNDTQNTFREIENFAKSNNLTFLMLNALYAYKGTEFYERMQSEGKLIPHTADYCNGMVPNVVYRNMTSKEMFDNILITLKSMYSPESICAKAMELFGPGKFKPVNRPDISMFLKLKIWMFMLFGFKFSKERGKRRLYSILMNLIKAGKTDRGAMYQYLMFVLSLQSYMKFAESMRPKIVASIKKIG